MFKSRKKTLSISLIALLLVIMVVFSGCQSGAMALINLLSPDTATEAESNSSNLTTDSNLDSSVSREDLIKSIVKVNSEPSVYGSAGTDVFAVSEVVRKVQESVVQIYTESGAGSGVIISSELGWVITCNHVIDGASNFVVELFDGTQYSATLQGADSDTDIAILKIDPSQRTLTAATLGVSDNLVVGEQIVVIGNPLGTLGGTVTQGIISAKERRISFNNDDGTTTVMTLIQTDAAINAGNSGGAMFNLKGELVGIVNAKYSSTGVEGLGFAIPIDKAYEVACELIQYRYVRGVPDDGLTLATKMYYSDYRAYIYGGSYNTALYVTESNYKPELKGKYIVSVNNIEVKSAAEYKAAIADCKVGDTITIQYVSQIGSNNRYTTTIILQEKVPSYIFSN